MALAIPVTHCRTSGLFPVFYCSSLTRGRLALLQAVEWWEFLAPSQVLSSFSVIMYAQHGERPALRELAFQLWFIPTDPSSFQWNVSFFEKFLC